MENNQCNEMESQLSILFQFLYLIEQLHRSIFLQAGSSSEGKEKESWTEFKIKYIAVINISDTRSCQDVEKSVLMPRIASRYKMKIPFKLYNKMIPCREAGWRVQDWTQVDG